MKELGAPLPVRISHCRKAQAHGRDSFDVEALLDVHQVGETVQQESSSDETHGTERDLQAYENGASAPALAAFRDRTATRFQAFLRIGSQHPPCGQQSEQNT